MGKIGNTKRKKCYAVDDEWQEKKGGLNANYSMRGCGLDRGWLTEKKIC